MPEDVKLKLKASLGMDASDVSKALEAVKTQVEGKPGSKPEADSMKYVTQWLERVIGKTGSFLESRKKLLASYQVEIAQVRRLEEEYRRLQNTKGADPDELRIQKGQILSGRAFTNKLRDAIQVGTAQETLEKEGQGGDKGGGLLGILSGGPGGILGAIKGVIQRHPIAAATIGTALAAKYMKDKFEDWSNASEVLETGFTNLGRRMGKGTGLRGLLEPGGTGKVSPRMNALGYSSVDVLRMAEAYNVPGKGLTGALESQAKFARAFGFGQNPEEISGIGRRATQLGIAEPGQQPAFWRLMADAVMHGNKAGMDASESMRALLNLTEEQAKMTGDTSRFVVAGLSGLQKVLTENNSRFFKGERGAENIGDLLSGLQNPQGVGMKRFIQNSIMGQFGNKMPSAQDLGLKGQEAKIYDEYDDLAKSEYIQQNLPEMLASGNSNVKFMGSRIMQDLSRAAGGNRGLEHRLLQKLTGWSGEKLMKGELALYKAAGDTGGDMGPLQAGAAVMAKATRAAREAQTGVEPPAGITMLEEKQRDQREAGEQFSKAVSDATLSLRTKFEVAVASAANALAEFTKRLREGPPAGGSIPYLEGHGGNRPTRPQQLNPAGP